MGPKRYLVLRRLHLARRALRDAASDATTVTDIATGWTECAPLLVREQRLLIEVLGELRKLLPFPLLGLDTDNDSVFMNETVRDYCQQVGIAFTRCRPYRKNDQAWVEQKNGAVVRRTIGYRRFEGLEAAATLAANDCSGDCGGKSPVDLPLRLDDAAASPTTPQGQHQ